MPIHVPLSLEARTEARMIMLASNNVLKPADGKPVMTPAQDIVLGCYYLTIEKPGAKAEGTAYTSEEEAIMAYQTKNVELQSKIYVRRRAVINGKTVTGRVSTTVGRILFNRCIPQDTGMVDRTIPGNELKYEVDCKVGKKELGNIVSAVYDKHGSTETVVMLDKIKELGYKYSTIAAITINVFDMKEPPEKATIVAEADQKVLANEKAYRMGIMSLDEKVNKNVAIWNEATNKVKDAVLANLEDLNPIKMMAISGARGNPGQINQLCGMRGVMASASGQKIDIPVKACFRSGLTPIDYFLSSRGGRKGLADTALKTADSGYLTRRLVDVAQDVVINEIDCFETLGEKTKGLVVTDIIEDGTVIETLEDRITGRVAVNNVVDPKTKEVLAQANEMITPAQAKTIVKAGIKAVEIRTALTCKSKHGVCAKCYGRNMANNKMVQVGEAVGTIAAQSIGEPGTQLTMRTFHTGGVASAADITKGLPRVEEIFEARRPKGEAIISEVAGKVTVEEDGEIYKVIVASSDGDIEYKTPPKNKTVLAVKTGDVVEVGQCLTSGSIYPNDILRVRGLRGVQEYLLKEVLEVYRLQDVRINAKHVEIIIRQMLRKVRIENPGDTELLPGDLIDLYRLEEANNEVLAKGGVPAVAKRILLGITKASLSVESFLSAASFQETSSVLTEAAIKGKVDPLIGLKENIIIGKRIPAGTGMKCYRNIYPEVSKEENVYAGVEEALENSTEEELF